MPVDRQARRDSGDAALEPVARPGNRGAAEVEGVTAAIQRDLHDVGIAQLACASYRVASRCHGRVAVCGEIGGDAPDERGLDQRLIALHIDNDMRAGIAAPRDDFGNAIGAGGMPARGHDRLEAVAPGRVRDAPIIGGDEHFRGAAPARLLGDAHHHRLARNVRERLAREACRRVAGGNDDAEPHTSSSGGSLRASSSSMTGISSLIG